MCGRYFFEEKFKDELEQFLERHMMQHAEEILPLASRQDVHPTDLAAVILQKPHQLVPAVEQMKWGYRGLPQLVFNARSESAAGKRLFADDMASRRCIIPASGFYEWDHDKNKVTFRLDAPLMFMAGLYRKGQPDPQNPGVERDEFVILTTEANESMRATHDRMPCFVTEEEMDAWLSDQEAGREILKRPQPQLLHTQDYEQLTLFG